MNKPLLVILILWLTGIQVASAQWRVGVNAGYAHNTLAIDRGYAYDMRYDSRGGFTMGVPVQYDFTDWFGLRAELAYVAKGQSVHRTHSFERLKSDIRNHYLQIPVMANFSFGGTRLRGFVNAGAYVGAWLASIEKGINVNVFGHLTDAELLNENTTYISDGKLDFDARRDNRFEAGLTGGLGIRYLLLPRMEVSLEGRCYYALTDQQKDYMYFHTPRYNTTFALLAGISFLLGK